VSKVRWKIATLLLSLYPLCLLSAFYTTWIAGRLELGYWPRSSLDDPKNIGGAFFPFYYEATGWVAAFGFPIVCIGVVAATILGLICICKTPEGWKVRLLELGLAWAIHVIVVVLFVWDPLRVVEWYFD
jgi:hypothetical protein